MKHFQPKLSLFIATVTTIQMLMLAPSLVESLATTDSPSNNNINVNTAAGDIDSLIKAAMHQTSKSSNSISSTIKADRLWETILGKVTPKYSIGRTNISPSTRIIPDNILVPSLSLHAAVLSRLGKDRQAIATFNEALELKQYLSNNSLVDVCLGKGYALQRSMRYDEARGMFIEVLDRSVTELKDDEKAARASVSAATCSLRLENLSGAFGALERYIGLYFGEEISSLDAEAAGLYGYLQHMQGGRKTLEQGSREYEYINHAAENPSLPLYHWLLRTITSKNIQMNMPHFPFLDMAAINQSPLDDARLIRLDDKVQLHQLLSSSPSCSSNRETTTIDLGDQYYIPDGFILPNETNQLKEYSQKHPSASWMIKERAGYGSQGNHVVPNTEQVLKIMHHEAVTVGDDAGEEEQVLCQRIVEPLLIYGCKFSMRVHVILLNNMHRKNGNSGNKADVYLCTNGLAKLALAPYEQGVYDMNNIDDAYMTNSGRKETSSSNQFDFHQLRMEFEDQNWDYDLMWKRIAEAVRRTMQSYYDTVEINNDYSSDHLSIFPKILGFDFLLDGNIVPKLIEIDRFPGLEPRSVDDEAVKRQVVEDAWHLACDAEGIPYSFLGLNEDKEKRDQESLQKLQMIS